MLWCVFWGFFIAQLLFCVAIVLVGYAAFMAVLMCDLKLDEIDHVYKCNIIVMLEYTSEKHLTLAEKVKSNCQYALTFCTNSLPVSLLSLKYKWKS